MSVLTDKANLIIQIVDTPEWEKDRQSKQMVDHLRRELSGLGGSKTEKDLIAIEKYGEVIINMHLENMTPCMIAKRLKITANFVIFCLQSEGYEPNKSNRPRKVFRYNATGEEGTKMDLLAIFKISASTFDNWRRIGKLTEVGKTYF